MMAAALPARPEHSGATVSALVSEALTLMNEAAKRRDYGDAGAQDLERQARALLEEVLHAH